MIEMKNVSKTYTTTARTGLFRKETRSVEAVRSVSLTIQPGEIVGLLGLNGAGKTTTIKMLSTLLEPTSGEITVDGLDIGRDRQAIQRQINVITGSERLLYWRLTGLENLLYFGRLYGLPEGELKQRCHELLDEVGLTEAADQPVEQYSKGMKQRLQIARGLINDPRYILLDEPTIGLDAPVARHLRGMVRRMAAEQGKGLLLTSHYLQEVEELCSRVYVLDKGKLILADSPEAIIRRVAGAERLRVEATGRWDGLAARLAAAMGMDPGRIRAGAEGAPAAERAPGSDGGAAAAAKLQGGADRSRPAFRGHAAGGPAPGDDAHGSVVIQAGEAGALAPRVLAWLAAQGLQVTRLSVEKPTLEDAIVALSGKGEQHELAPVPSSLPG